MEYIMADILTTSPLAPSELVLLNAETFAAKAGAISLNDVNIAVFDADKKVSARQLGQAILAVALLANEQAGVIRLEPRAKKTLFGLRTVQALYADPAQGEAAWPENSLESKVRAIVEERASKGRNEVENVLYDLLESDTGSAWQWTTSLVKQGLDNRGLLETVQRKQLKVFTINEYALPESTAALASQQDLKPVQRLLARYEQEKPEVWKLLTSQIQSAINKRTESDDNDWND
jgi:hypothetical protein